MMNIAEKSVSQMKHPSNAPTTTASSDEVASSEPSTEIAERALITTLAEDSVRFLFSGSVAGISLHVISAVLRYSDIYW